MCYGYENQKSEAMGYYFSKILDCPFEEAETRVRQGLEQQSMGIIMEIDFQANFRKKLNIEFRPYKILGACSASHAYRSIREEDKVAILMPCNVLVQQVGENRTEVAAMDPEGAMMAVENQEVKCIGGEVRLKLKRLIEEL